MFGLFGRSFMLGQMDFCPVSQVNHVYMILCSLCVGCLTQFLLLLIIACVPNYYMKLIIFKNAKKRAGDKLRDKFRSGFR